MRTMRTLGFTLALALMAVSMSAEAKEGGLSPPSRMVTVHEDSTLAPANVLVVMDLKDVKATTFRSAQPRDVSDITPSPEVLEVALGRWHSVFASSSMSFDFIVDNRYGSRNVPVLRTVEAKTYRHLSTRRYASVNSKPLFDSSSGGSRRDVCPLRGSNAIYI